MCKCAVNKGGPKHIVQTTAMNDLEKRLKAKVDEEKICWMKADRRGECEHGCVAADNFGLYFGCKLESGTHD